MSANLRFHVTFAWQGTPPHLGRQAGLLESDLTRRQEYLDTTSQDGGGGELLVKVLAVRSSRSAAHAIAQAADCFDRVLEDHHTQTDGLQVAAERIGPSHPDFNKGTKPADPEEEQHA